MKLQHLLRNSVLVAVFGAFALAASSPAHAGPMAIWTDWTSSSGNTSNVSNGWAVGTMDGVGVYYTGQTVGLSSTYNSQYPGSGGIGVWNPGLSWTGGWVTNAPPTSFDSVGLYGGAAGTEADPGAIETISFSSPVTDPVMAIWSLGGSAGPAEFDFTSGEPFTIIAGGPNAQFGGGPITASGETVYGTEGNGTIEFNGIYSSISFTTPIFENYYAFTFGEQTPEPETLSLLGLGLLALPLLRASLARRRRA